MKIAVWDTYVSRRNGQVMHFDILAEEGTAFETVQQYGNHYLDTVNEAGQPLTSRECRFCHIEEATEELKQKIEAQGYAIIEMEGCET